MWQLEQSCCSTLQALRVALMCTTTSVASTSSTGHAVHGGSHSRPQGLRQGCYLNSCDSFALSDDCSAGCSSSGLCSNPIKHFSNNA